MKISDADVAELQKKYSYLINDQSDSPLDPIDPLTYMDSNDDSLLHIAAQHNDLRTLEILLNAGMDVNMLGDMSYTALHYATSQEVIDFLLARGASPHIKNEFGMLPNCVAEVDSNKNVELPPSE